MGEQTNHIRQLEEAIHSCDVSFQVWQNQEPTGKPVPGSFDFTPLSGKDKLKVFQEATSKDGLLIAGGFGSLSCKTETYATISVCDYIVWVFTFPGFTLPSLHNFECLTIHGWAWHFSWKGVVRKYTTFFLQAVTKHVHVLTGKAVGEWLSGVRKALWKTSMQERYTVYVRCS